jgi:PAS domain S-box-containing protein
MPTERGIGVFPRSLGEPVFYRAFGSRSASGLGACFPAHYAVPRKTSKRLTTPPKRATARARSPARLQQQARLYEITLSSIADFAYIFDRQGRFIFANQALATLLGITPAAMVGKNFFDLNYPAELAAKLQEQIEHVFTAKEIVQDETPFTSPTGKEGYYEYIFRPVLAADGTVEVVAGSTRDITARKKSERALRESEEHFRLLVDGARDYAMFLLDPENVITFWNAGAERVFGWKQTEAIGKSGAMTFTPEDRRKGEVEKEINIALNDGRAPDRRFHLRKDGSRFWADGVLMRLDDESGKLRGFAKVARDATDQRRAQDELAHARDELEQRVLDRTRELVAMNNELERTMADRQQLERELLEISEREKRRIGEDLHDMVCQELTATALFLKSTAQRIAAESAAAAKTLDESAQTVNRNVVIARELAGGLQAIELAATGLKNALRNLAAQACENSGIKCHFKCARGVHIPDDAAALHLYRVAQEAVTNAVKHSGAKNILISLDRDSKHTCVSVQDDGKGFTVRKRGKGLGLHMMRYRANALGGELKITRRKTGGMDITCIIPTKR